MEIREEILSGFCKALNQTRSVFCEFEQTEDGWNLTDYDCDFGECPHSENCILMAQRKEIEQNK